MTDEPCEMDPVEIPLREELRAFFEGVEKLRREYADGISAYNVKRAQRAIDDEARSEQRPKGSAPAPYRRPPR